jgi:tetratricopeptide (TPR) repeat protein
MRGSGPPLAGLAAASLYLAACSPIGGTKVDRLPDNAASRGFVVVSRPVALPRSRLTADCLPESICAVVNFWGKSASVQELSILVRNPEVPGIPTHFVGKLARAKGLNAVLLHGTIGHVKNAIDRDVPPIIMVKTGGKDFHFYVVTGYNDREQVIVCEEYDNSKRLLGYEEVEDLWTDPKHERNADHFMMELQRSTAGDDYESGADREARGRYGEAITLYKRALEADPAHYEARVGLGNCYLFTRKLDEAMAEYKRAYEINPADPKVCNNLANVYIELKRDAAEAVRLAGAAVDRYRAEVGHSREDVARETQPTVRAIRQQELALRELDLADALGTFGQAHALAGQHALAISAWKASLDHYPLTEFDSRARRNLEIGLSCRALSMPAEARTHLLRALEEAKDPLLREKIQAALKE